MGGMPDMSCGSGIGSRGIFNGTLPAAGPPTKVPSLVKPADPTAIGPISRPLGRGERGPAHTGYLIDRKAIDRPGGTP